MRSSVGMLVPAADPGPPAWASCSLESVAERVTVGHVGPMAHEYVAAGIPFLRSQDVAPLRIRSGDLKYIPPEFHRRLSKSALAPGDVVIVRTGRPGTAAVVPSDLLIANCADLVIVRPGPELDAHFLAYYLNTAATGYVSAHLVGAVQQHFNVTSARALTLRLPPLDEQRRIAAVLGALDEKIDGNRRLAKTLTDVIREEFRHQCVELRHLESTIVDLAAPEFRSSFDVVGAESWLCAGVLWHRTGVRRVSMGLAPRGVRRVAWRGPARERRGAGTAAVGRRRARGGCRADLG